MKRLISAKLAVMLTALATLTALTLPFVSSHNHLQSAQAVGNLSAVSNVLAQFFPNPNDSGTFDINPSATPAFNQPFSTIDFNPPTNMQSCTNSTGVDENTRPFTNISADGTCATTIAQGNGQQAGLNNLFSFEAVFIAALSVPQAGQMDMNIYADDGWILSIGKDSNGKQPTYVAGPMNNAPANGKGPFSGNTVVGANNVPSPPALLTVTASFPAAGTYPIEMDYTECCAGQLTLILGDPVSSTATPTPVATSTPVPGGTWISPSGQFAITGDTFHFAAHAYHTNAGDPFIDHVNFTAYYLGVNPDVWTIPCKVTSPTPGTTDIYECDWTLSPGVPNGPITVSFDVYDTANNKNLAPNGTLQGTINRSGQPALLAPVPSGVELKIIHGYNDPLPSKDNVNCPNPKDGIADHCANQQYGLDLVPANPTSNIHIIAPAAGTAFTSGECLFLTLDIGNVNLTICHFFSFNPKLTPGMHVDRGFFLGTMKDNSHIHLNLDDRNDTISPNPGCSAQFPRTCRPIPFNGGYFTLENQSFDPGFNQDGSPIQNQFDTCDAQQQNCILITSSNTELPN